MPPRSFTIPAPKTESAREARKSFFCELCQKGYSRMNEFEAHESSYDHQHKKRLKEMKQMQRDPNAVSKARKAERKADEKSGLITIKPVKLESSSSGATGGFKKGGFKSAFGSIKKEDNSSPPDVFGDESKRPIESSVAKPSSAPGLESDTEDEGYEYYDPRRPTD